MFSTGFLFCEKVQLLKHVENVETASVEKRAVEIMLVKLLFHKAGLFCKYKKRTFFQLEERPLFAECVYLTGIQTVKYILRNAYLSGEERCTLKMSWLRCQLLPQHCQIQPVHAAVAVAVCQCCSGFRQGLAVQQVLL